MHIHPVLLRKQISVAAFKKVSQVNGPGKRSVLWVQGCHLNCPGCFNKEFQEFNYKNIYQPKEIVRWILDVSDSEGVTFSGGEPFDQAAGLAEVALEVKRNNRSVVVFTGYTKRIIFESTNKAVKKFISAIDLIIAGPYMRDSNCKHPLLSSSNQELVFVTKRYWNYSFEKKKKKIEFTIDKDGEVSVTGFPIK